MEFFSSAVEVHLKTSVVSLRCRSGKWRCFELMEGSRR